MTDQTFEIPFSQVPIPTPCGPQTVASFTVRLTQEVWGEDRTVIVVRSCNHSYYYSSRTIDPVVGSPAMTCLGPQPDTLPSGRFDKSVPPLKKGKRWTNLPRGKDRVA